ncbi:ribonuclease P complex subunit [Chlorella sorokiniana]|uniref:Ribonuclease P complex subunit n=1 Tax=Chlorella sorokiniana TaxID=3076 RepID=A0A2P6TEE7_CHLSO|nr:ribonuclease P complex subunit [Chlorella sorokiniana]|eukprot:PRW21018.1 ribonuclease P complex subunit [Chlorella sorokiniana]
MSLPYHDLAASNTLLEANTQRERVSYAIKLGWDVVGLAHQATAKLAEAQDRCAIRPTELQELLAAVQGVREALAAAELRTAAGRGGRHGDPYTVRQLTRINIPADDPAVAQAACASAIARGYDLVAVQPQTERLFQLACASLECDLISVDLSRRLPYRFKPALVKAALARGLHFEICFAPALREAGARRQLFANALALARETRGRGLVISSGARSYMELRGPLDVINLATLSSSRPSTMGNRVARLAYTNEATAAAWAVVGKRGLTSVPATPEAEAQLFTDVAAELRRQALGMPPGLNRTSLAAAVREMAQGACSNPVAAAVQHRS